MGGFFIADALWHPPFTPHVIFWAVYNVLFCLFFYRHARGMGLDHDTSLDLVQDAFVRAYERLEDCREGANYRAWLFRICRNLCLDELRNVRRLSVPMSHIENADDLESPHVVGDETTLTLRAALDRLPNALREAFLLKHDAGYTYEEVAEITEASPSAVKMRVHRAREALRAFLEAQGWATQTS